MNPGSTVFPPRSTFLLAPLASPRISSFEPTARMRSPWIATACARGSFSLTVQIFPLWRIRSGSRREIGRSEKAPRLQMNSRRDHFPKRPEEPTLFICNRFTSIVTACVEDQIESTRLSALPPGIRRRTEAQNLRKTAVPEPPESPDPWPGPYKRRRPHRSWRSQSAPHASVRYRTDAFPQANPDPTRGCTHTHIRAANDSR